MGRKTRQRVAVAVGVLVGAARVPVGVGVAVLVAVGVGVLVGAARVPVGVGVAVLVAVGVGVLVGAARVPVGVGVAVLVAVGVGVLVGDARVPVGVGVAVLVGAARVPVGVGVAVLVAVGVGVLVAAGLLPISTAPMSQVRLVAPKTGRTTPRWSVAWQAPPPLPGAAGLPASMAGLPGKSACVEVGPPLFVSGPSLGLMGATSEPSWSPAPALSAQPVALPIRLWPPEVSVPAQSGSGLDIDAFPAIMLLATVTLPAVENRPLDCLLLVLSVIVTLLSARLPLLL